MTPLEIPAELSDAPVKKPRKPRVSGFVISGVINGERHDLAMSKGAFDRTLPIVAADAEHPRREWKRQRDAMIHFRHLLKMAAIHKGTMVDEHRAVVALLALAPTIQVESLAKREKDRRAAEKAARTKRGRKAK